jgi:AcrR family transcriptional regulator
MDDISQALGISKKTLYQVVPNKAGLIRTILKRFLEEENVRINELKGEAQDPIHELILIAQHVSSILKRMSPVAIYDLKKYYVEEWRAMESERSNLILTDIKNNLQRGMLQNLYRDDLDSDLLANLYLRMATFITDEKVFETPASRREQMYGEFVKYHIRGISTSKGIRLLIKYEHLLNS